MTRFELVLQLQFYNMFLKLVLPPEIEPSFEAGMCLFLATSGGICLSPLAGKASLGAVQISWCRANRHRRVCGVSGLVSSPLDLQSAREENSFLCAWLHVYILKCMHIYIYIFIYIYIYIYIYIHIHIHIFRSRCIQLLSPFGQLINWVQRSIKETDRRRFELLKRIKEQKRSILVYHPKMVIVLPEKDTNWWSR